MCIRLPNSCFVHIPRTGGLWLGVVVEKLGIKHQTLKGDIDSHFSYNQLPDNWKKLHSFSIVRSPLDWVCSRWSHAISINAYKDYRHYGIHRLFDECVRPTLVDTIKTIMEYQPGLVGRTYWEMTEGVNVLGRTENLVEDVYRILSTFEGVTKDALNIMKSIQKHNSTSDLYIKELGKIPYKLAQEFNESEVKAFSIWRNAREIISYF